MRLKSELQLTCLFGLIVYEVVNPYTDRIEEWMRTTDPRVMSLNPEIEDITVKVLGNNYKAKTLLFSFLEPEWNDLFKDEAQGH